MVIDVMEKEESVDEIVFGDGKCECQALALIGGGRTFSMVDHHGNTAEFIEMDDVENLILALMFCPGSFVKNAQRRWTK